MPMALGKVVRPGLPSAWIKLMGVDSGFSWLALSTGIFWVAPVLWEGLRSSAM